MFVRSTEDIYFYRYRNCSVLYECQFIMSLSSALVYAGCRFAVNSWIRMGGWLLVTWLFSSLPLGCMGGSVYRYIVVNTHSRHVLAAGRELADLEPDEQVVLGVQVRGAAGRGHGGGAPLGGAHRRRDRDGGRQHAARGRAASTPGYWTHAAVLLRVLV